MRAASESTDREPACATPHGDIFTMSESTSTVRSSVQKNATNIDVRNIPVTNFSAGG
jgi:hypothetical protein